MKLMPRCNFISHIAISATILTSLLVPSLGQTVESATSRYPITPEQREIAQQVATAGVPLSELADNAPDKYVVVPHDTLWDISSKFLKSPWRWPELWGMNKEQIHNPHLIYPGQILLLIRTGDRAYLRLADQVIGPDGTVKLSPTIRGEFIGKTPIPSIPYNDIAPFLSQPLIIDEKLLKSAPRIVATQEGRLKLGTGDYAYVRGISDESITDYFVFRPAQPLRDPDTHEILAYEAFFLGSARLTRKGDPATFNILNAKEEIGIDDRLVKTEKPAFINYVPHAPSADTEGRVVSVYGGVTLAGSNQIIAINRGKNHGLTVGDVFALAHHGDQIKDRTSEKNETVKLPNEPYGFAFVFRIFDNVSYALVLNVHMPVEIGDIVQKP